MSETGWQEDGSYVSCPECLWEPAPEPRNKLPGKVVRSPMTWHYSDCPTVPQLSPEKQKELQKRLDDMDRRIYRYR